MLFSALVTIIGLSLFEAVSSVDNAIINAEVLSTMGAKARRWFLTWGMFIAVFLVRGLLPFAIIWAFNTSLNPLQVLSAAWSSDPLVLESIEKSAPILLVAGGVFLLFLFLHWLFLEEKHFGLPKAEKFFMSKGVWFYATVSILLAIIAWFALKESNLMGFGAVVGSSLFFITHGFKQNAEEQEQKLLGSSSSDLSKLFFLEIIDTTFSIDGVLGAFAFTLSVPLILLGNGFGALLVRQLTVSNIERIKKYVYLKNGAMYSILVLGVIMILHSFGFHIPEYLSPLCTFIIIGFFFWKSKMHLKLEK
ncbi:hypothetical protein A2643_02460 [Candidatus Nomurabacteria bacterium RIFCSPHIGHO2_01_FULL_39_220]|uniref:DUF475 domain-containing protein n=1 Tax=Candidatus Nomurabacteria bacterium RIFCSPLOWO2_02_FULL_40_67 TaxID=1801787 RepID=A0A1F6Y5Y7_9BACT|nr:MAG: hypothetical protein UU01_C0008G0011 [Parcubacteria group bacterium GW2011_GWA2_40_37]KKS16255.1 MAG: hypothetical protein UU71_C0005G0005 [Parcubacteria group bacterium GW2011_GWB1_41_6]KKS73273.1 MAG: hypothetical protein UV43_C0006G0007 [Parcubacteria group bacterium GW2011_GWF2_42_7]OGI63235.1 MAG: hypothetical protein A2W12_00810 [Candidatus Nomurabacteria bacterium RBG_16_40_11]OGI70762.1 MAG: hypothetical protein A2643_02460 [Candidatus Nomurabacteria bacterium RIFCSPHIGHO2_01_FU